MKNLLILFFAIFISLSCFSQVKKSTRYFYFTCNFRSTDGCSHNQFGKYVNYINGTTYGYDDIVKVIVKYIRPYSIVKGTFRINEYRQLSRREYLTYKASKFKPCKQVPLSTISISSTAKFSSDLNKEILNISESDSTGIYTVRFSKSVRFINDTTFTFKILTP